MTGGRHLVRWEPLTPIGGTPVLTVAVRPSNLDRHVVHSKPPDDRDLEHHRVPGMDSCGVVSGDDIEFTGQDPLGQLGQVERGRLSRGAPPEPRGNGDHGRTFNRKCFRDVTRPESLGDGAEVGGYLRNLNVMLPRAPAALPSDRAAAREAVVRLTPAA